VIDEETGLLVSPGDSGALRTAIERLLADPGARARFGAAARERARAWFSRDAETAALLSAWDDALRLPG
jgi:glycosyltransferase involved in cell wall biosynthesis